MLIIEALSMASTFAAAAHARCPGGGPLTCADPPWFVTRLERLLKRRLILLAFDLEWNGLATSRRYQANQRFSFLI
jgi:hypothetical protein